MGIGHRLVQGRSVACGGQDIIGTAGPPAGDRQQLRMLADDPELFEAEVLHHPRRGADIAGFAGLDQDDAKHFRSLSRA